MEDAEGIIWVTRDTDPMSSLDRYPLGTNECSAV